MASSRSVFLSALGAGFGLALSVGSAIAGLSLSGPTGLVMIPTALTLREWEVDLAVDRWTFSAPGGRGDFTDLRAGVGVTSTVDSGLELGLVAPDARRIGLDSAYLFGKYRIPGVLPGGALAVGGIFSTDKTHYSSIFFVGSSAVAPNFALHYGGGVNVYGDPLGWAWFGGRRDNGRANGAFALFGGEVDWRRFKLNIDYNGSFMSYGINYFPDSFFSINLFHLGRGDFERAAGISHRLGYGATVRF